MIRYLALVAVLTVSTTWTSFIAAQQPAEGTDQVKELDDFLKQTVTVIEKQERDVQEKLQKLNEADRIVDIVTANASNDDAESLAQMSIAAAQFQRAMEAMEVATQGQGKALTRVRNLFDVVERKEADGTVPLGTLKPAYEKAHDLSRSTFERAHDAVSRARGEILEDFENLKNAGVNVPVIEGSRKGIVVVSSYLPQGTVSGGSAEGFVVLVNYSADRTHSGTLSWADDGDGAVSPNAQSFSIGPGNAMRIDFTVTVNSGTLTYTPKLEWR